MARDPLTVALIAARVTTAGGTGRHVCELAGWLVARGHQVSILCSEVEPPAVPEGVRLDRIVGGRSALSRAVRASCDAYDVVQSFDRLPGGQIFRAGGGAHRAFLEATRGSWRRWLPWHRAEHRAEAAAIRDARLVVCNSEQGAADVVRWHGAEERVRVVRNGVDAGRFRPDEERRRAARARFGVRAGAAVLFLGNGFRRKGLRVAAEAFCRCAGPGDRFVVAGTDAHAGRYRRSLERALAARLVWLGDVAEPERWLPGADVVVLATRYDPAANTTLQAMACGVPAVTTVRDGSSELVPDPRLVVRDPGDVAEVAAAVRYALQDPRTLGRRCREAMEAWPLARMGMAMEALYAEVARG